MKLLIVTFLKDYHGDVLKIFKQAGVAVFSIADVTGFKDSQSPDLLEDWFASGDEKFDSQVIFSFTDNPRVDQVLQLANTYNTQNQTGFPVRAFILPVEKSNL